MAYTYHVIKFRHLELIHVTAWIQSISDGGVFYKAKSDPYSKILVRPLTGTKKLFHVPKDRSVFVIDNTAHFVGEAE